MSPAAADLLAEAAEDLGVEVDVRPDYSGRGMYGATTHAVVLAESDALAVAFRAGELASEQEAAGTLVSHDLLELRRDSMGRSGLVLY